MPTAKYYGFSMSLLKHHLKAERNTLVFSQLRMQQNSRTDLDNISVHTTLLTQV